MKGLTTLSEGIQEALVVSNMVGRPQASFRWASPWHVKLFLKFLDDVGWMTGRASWAGCWFVGGDDLIGALHVLLPQLSPPPPSSLKVKDKVNHAPQESVGCSSPSSIPWACRWITTNVCDAWSLRRQTYGYLPNRNASLPVGWYQIILLGDIIVSHSEIQSGRHSGTSDILLLKKITIF